MNRVSIMAILFALLFLPFLFSAADAYHSRGYAGQHHYRQLAYQDLDGCPLTNDGRRICDTNFQSASSATVDTIGNRGFARADAGTIIGSRPNGCPHSYCGCGLRKYLGISDVRLNLASNWARLLPREAGPLPGLAAVRRGHVMILRPPRAMGSG
jgi:hypothetical protein